MLGEYITEFAIVNDGPRPRDPIPAERNGVTAYRRQPQGSGCRGVPALGAPGRPRRTAPTGGDFSIAWDTLKVRLRVQREVLSGLGQLEAFSELVFIHN